MIVGSVLIVDVSTNAPLDANANMYNHHHWVLNSNPGMMITSLVVNDNASIMFTFVQ